MRAYDAAMRRFPPLSVLLATIVVPAIWIGMLIAIDAIEAPLKFTAPGITIPLGLGIGRRVFFALNIAEIILAVTWCVLLVRGRALRRLGKPLAFAAALLLVKVLIIRPLLWSYTDAVLAGTSAGGSPVHLLYVGCDLVLGVVLCWAVWHGIRSLKLAVEGDVAPLTTSNVGGTS